MTAEIKIEGGQIEGDVTGSASVATAGARRDELLPDGLGQNGLSRDAFESSGRPGISEGQPFQSGGPLSALVVLYCWTLLCDGAVTAGFAKFAISEALSWSRLVALAGFLVAAVGAVHALAFAAALAAFREHVEETARALAAALWPAMAWLPALVLLAREQSIWVIFLVPLMAARTVVFFQRRGVGWQLENGTASVENRDSQPGWTSGWFQLLDDQTLYEPAMNERARALRMLPAVLVAVFIESGLAAIAAQDVQVGSCLLAASMGIGIWLYPSRRKPQLAGDSPGLGDGSSGVRRNRAASRSRVASVIAWSLAAALLTALALMPYLGAGRFAQAARALLGIASAGPGMSGRGMSGPGTSGPAMAARAQAGKDSLGSFYSGVILLLPPKPAQEIQPPVAVTAVNAGAGRAKPVVIPFDGAYWYFRPWDERPKPDARVIRGDPAKADIHSTDPEPVSMEAHQQLAESVMMDCCKAIRVTVRNQEKRPGPILVGVTLKHNGLDSGLAGGRVGDRVGERAGGQVGGMGESYSQPLGSLLIPSSSIRRTDYPEPGVSRQFATEEVLTFQFPASSQGKVANSRRQEARERNSREAYARQFNEIAVTIQWGRGDSPAAAHVAIEQFELVPR